MWCIKDCAFLHSGIGHELGCVSLEILEMVSNSSKAVGPGHRIH